MNINDALKSRITELGFPPSGAYAASSNLIEQQLVDHKRVWIINTVTGFQAFAEKDCSIEELKQHKLWP